MDNLKEMINLTEMELNTKINHFNNIVDDDLAEILIKEIAVLEEKQNYLYKQAKRMII